MKMFKPKWLQVFNRQRRHAAPQNPFLKNLNFNFYNSISSLTEKVDD